MDYYKLLNTISYLKYKMPSATKSYFSCLPLLTVVNVGNCGDISSPPLHRIQDLLLQLPHITTPTLTYWATGRPIPLTNWPVWRAFRRALQITLSRAAVDLNNRLVSYGAEVHFCVLIICTSPPHTPQASHKWNSSRTNWSYAILCFRACIDSAWVLVLCVIY